MKLVCGLGGEIEHPPAEIAPFLRVRAMSHGADMQRSAGSLKIGCAARRTLWAKVEESRTSLLGTYPQPALPPSLPTATLGRPDARYCSGPAAAPRSSAQHLSVG